MHPEIRLGRGLNAISAPAEINVVQVHFQNLRFAGLGLQLQRQPHFLQLAGHGFPGAQVAQLHQLLGDGTGPFGVVPGAEIGAQRAENADQVDAVMLVKAQILGRQESVLHLLRHLGQRNAHPVLGGLDFGDEFPVPVIDRAGLGNFRQFAHIQRLPGTNVERKVKRRRAADEEQKQGNQHPAPKPPAADAVQLFQVPQAFPALFFLHPPDVLSPSALAHPSAPPLRFFIWKVCPEKNGVYAGMVFQLDARWLSFQPQNCIFGAKPLVIFLPYWYDRHKSKH